VSSANLDLVRSIYAAWERGDYSSVEWAHSEMELVIVDGPSPGRWRGLTGMAEGVRSILGAWEDWHAEVDEFRELDDERVLALVRFRGRGKTSGLELEQMRARGASVFHVHDEKVTRQVIYFDRDRALTELDVAPEASSPPS
jgi:ketosteroid isomerase-like protein